MRYFVALLGVSLICVLAGGFAAVRAPDAVAAPNPDWVATWTAPPSETGSVLPDVTFRNIVHTSIGGTEVRVKYSNRYSNAPVTIGHATVALPATSGSTERSVLPGSMREVSFGGNAAVTIPAGGDVWSDPVELTVAGHTNLLLSFHIPGPSPSLTRHGLGLQESFYVGGVDRASSLAGADFPVSTANVYVTSQIDVRNSEAAGAVVTFGDSITDGVSSPASTNQRWPNRLSERFNQAGSGDVLAVVNAGISGNRLLTDGAGRAGTSRFAWDVLDVSGVKSVVIFIGINDIQHLPGQTTSAGLIDGYTAIATQARAAGLTVFGGTILPTKGYHQYSEANDVIRTTVNNWIRTSPLFDAVFDFDEAMRDPLDPQRLLPMYDSGDFLHPNPVAFQFMASIADVITRPQLELGLAPSEPDGDNGWWTSPVQITPTVTATPQPSYAPDMTYTVNGENRPAVGTQLLLDEDGEFDITARAAYATVASETELLAVKIDTSAPTSTATFDSQSSTFSLEGEDAPGGSGLAALEFSTGSASGPFTPYEGPVALNRSVNHVVYHRARDLAGNLSEVGELAVPALPAPVVAVKSNTKAKANGWKLKLTVKAPGRPASQVKGKAVVVIKRGGKKILSKTVNVRSGKATLALGKVKRDSKKLKKKAAKSGKRKKKAAYKVKVTFKPATPRTIRRSTAKQTFKR